MAVTQISRIQHRRGLEQDLPQLSSAELGWPKCLGSCSKKLSRQI